MTKPLYPANDYKAFVQYQKRKGLLRKHWNKLPAMWKKELKFRRDFENCLRGPKSRST